MVIVIGSINLDFVFSSDKYPKKGETIIGNSFDIFPGGKGCNQAFYAAKKAKTKLIGALGNDFYSDKFYEYLMKNNIDCSSIMRCDDNMGIAFINIAEDDNKIVTIPGANNKLTLEYIIKSLENVSKEDIILLQNEINKEVLEAICEYLAENNINYIYNPAPYIDVDEKVFKFATYITPNETEYSYINNKYGEKYDEKVILTLGAQGIKILKDNKLIKAKEVKAVDTTGAGDSFNGTLAAYLLTTNIYEAVEKSCEVATDSVMSLGAQGTKLIV